MAQTPRSPRVAKKVAGQNPASEHADETIADAVARPFVEQFSSNREALFSILRDARLDPFPNEQIRQEAERTTWDALLIAAIFHFGARDAREAKRKEREQRKYIMKTAAAVKKARADIENCARDANKMSIEHPLNLYLGKNGWVRWANALAKSRDILPILAEIEAAAAGAIAPSLARRRPKGTAALSNEIVHALAAQYRAFTERLPTTGISEHFRLFVSAFLKAVQYSYIGDKAVWNALTRGQTWSLENRGDSPFRETPTQLPHEEGRKIVLANGDYVTVGPKVSPAEITRLRKHFSQEPSW